MFFHVWFVTKYRKPILKSDIEKLIKAIFAECIRRHNYKILELETNRDHVHFLASVKDKTELVGVVKTLKAVSAKEILRTPHFRVGNVKHFWAKGYGCRRIRESEIENITEYIRNQKKIPHTAVCGAEY